MRLSLRGRFCAGTKTIFRKKDEQNRGSHQYTRRYVQACAVIARKLTDPGHAGNTETRSEVEHRKDNAISPPIGDVAVIPLDQECENVKLRTQQETKQNRAHDCGVGVEGIENA